MKRLIKPKPQARFVFPVCPVCNSTQKYFRKKTEDYLCRRCGTTYSRVGKIVQKSLPGELMTKYKVAVISKGRSKNTGRRASAK